MAELKPYRVLIVDDKKDVCDLLAVVLRVLGYPSVAAHSVPQALELLSQPNDIQIVITDLAFPEVDGYYLVEELAKRPNHPPIITLTAYSSLESSVRALRLGAFDYLIKPFDQETVRIAMDRAVRYLQQLRSEEEARQEEERYRHLFEESMDPIIIADTAGQIMDANRRACELLGYRKAELTTMTVRDLQLPDSFWARVPELKEGQEIEIELDLSARQGKALILQLRIKRFIYRGKEYYQAIGRDISAQRVAETMRQDMIGMLVHDLRSPLTVIMSGIETLRLLHERGQSEAALDTFLEVATHSGRRMLRLTNTMLDFYRLEEGGFPLQIAPLALPNVVQEMMPEFSALSAYQEVKLENHVSPDLPLVMADQDLLDRVLGNLLDNAIKFSPRDGTVTISAIVDEEPGFITVSVADQGAGIAAKDRDQLFQKFSQIRPEGSRRRGAGLGLAFCRLAVEAQGGRIWLESPAEGGSVFRFTVPTVYPLTGSKDG